MQVADRVLYFNEENPNGSIRTKIISNLGDEMVVMKALITPDAKHEKRVFTGYSQAKWGDGYVNKKSALENCETSAVGRALAMMGIGVIESIASVDEINKAKTATEVKPWLSNAKKELMLTYIQEGRGDEVRKGLKKYKLSRKYKNEIDSEFAKNYKLEKKDSIKEAVDFVKNLE